MATRYSKALTEMLIRIGNPMADHHETNLVRQGAVSLVNYADSLEKLILNKSPRDTDEGHALKVADAAKTIKQKLEKAKQSQAEKIQSARDALNREISQKALLQPSANAAEIRSILRGMNTSERLELISDAAKNGDAEILSAVDGVHKVLTGLDQDMQHRFVGIYKERMAPEAVAAMQALDDYEAALPKMFDITYRSAEEAYDPRYIAELNEAEANAEQIAKDFKSFVNQEAV